MPGVRAPGAAQRRAYGWRILPPAVKKAPPRKAQSKSGDQPKPSSSEAARDEAATEAATVEPAPSEGPRPTAPRGSAAGEGVRVVGAAAGPKAASSRDSVTIRKPTPVGTKRPTGPNVTAYWIPAMTDDEAKEALAAPPVVIPAPTGPPPIMALPTVSVSIPSSSSSSPSAAPVSAAAPPVKVGLPAVVTVSAQPGRPANATPMRPGTVIVADGASAGRTTAGAQNQTPEPASTLPAGAVTSPFRVGPYEVALRIARGGTGSVYVCRKQSEPSRLLTLKVIRQHAPEKELAAASLKHEALVGSLFRHPTAHTALQSGEFEGQPYIILDYLEGGCLADVLTEETRPTPAIAVTIVLDILGSLQALHQAVDSTGKPLGLIHCDVSPDNVLIGIDGVSQLADFGSARITAFAKEAQPFAVTKPPYMPPEQFRGEELDARADIYSAGVMLWTALTGQQPFAADTYDQTAINVMRKMVKPPSAFGAPACLDDVCMQAMSRSAERRFRVAGAMATALREVAQAQGLVAPHDEVGRWLRMAMADELARRRRQIDAMFGGGGRVPAHSQQDAQARAHRAATGARPPSSSSAGRTPPLGEQTLRARHGSGAYPTRRRPRLTPKQQAIIAVASGLAFASTIAVGLALMPSSGPRRPAHARPAATASASPSPPGPSARGETVGQGAR